ncbi:hypothetical protein JCM6882_008617 [Rhodosporidiobolus microsporus]
MTTNPSTDLPDELIEHIVSFLPPRSASTVRQRTLAALARTSKRLRQVAIPLLYRTIDIDQTRPPDAAVSWEENERLRLHDQQQRGVTDYLAVVPIPYVGDAVVSATRWKRLDERLPLGVLSSLAKNPHLAALVREVRLKTIDKPVKDILAVLGDVGRVCAGLKTARVSAIGGWNSLDDEEEAPELFPPQLKSLSWHAVHKDDAQTVLRALSSLEDLEHLSLTLGAVEVWYVNGQLPASYQLTSLDLHPAVLRNTFTSLLASSASTLTTLSFHLVSSTYDLSPYRSLRTLTIFFSHHPAACETLRTCAPSLQSVELAFWLLTDSPRQVHLNSLAALLASVPPSTTSLSLPFHLSPAAARAADPFGPREDERAALLSALADEAWLPQLAQLAMATQPDRTKWGRMEQLARFQEGARDACEKRGVRFIGREDGHWKERKRGERE